MISDFFCCAGVPLGVPHSQDYQRLTTLFIANINGRLYEFIRRSFGCARPLSGPRFVQTRSAPLAQRRPYAFRLSKNLSPGWFLHNTLSAKDLRQFLAIADYSLYSRSE
jgi:hypothetical protein